MYGRYTLKTPVEQLSEKFQFPETVTGDQAQTPAQTERDSEAVVG
jgi:hypothetical protein